MIENDSAHPSARTPANGEMLSTREAAEATGLTVFTLDQYRQLRKRGVDRGPEFVREGRSVLYPRRAVDAWLARRREG